MVDYIIYQDGDSAWFFLNPDTNTWYGPYPTEEDARNGLDDYNRLVEMDTGRINDQT